MKQRRNLAVKKNVSNEPVTTQETEETKLEPGSATATTASDGTQTNIFSDGSDVTGGDLAGEQENEGTEQEGDLSKLTTQSGTQPEITEPEHKKVPEVQSLFTEEMLKNISWRKIQEYIQKMARGGTKTSEERAGAQFFFRNALINLILAPVEDAEATANVRKILEIIRQNSAPHQAFHITNAHRALDIVSSRIGAEGTQEFKVVYTVLLKLAEEGKNYKADWSVVSNSITNGKGEITANRLMAAVGIRD